MNPFVTRIPILRMNTAGERFEFHEIEIRENDRDRVFGWKSFRKMSRMLATNNLLECTQIDEIMRIVERYTGKQAK